MIFIVKGKLDKSKLDNANKNISVEKVTWTQTNVWDDSGHDKLGLIVKNSNDSDLDITIRASLYDQEGNFIEKRESTIKALGSNEDYFLPVMADSNAKDIKYEYECDNTSYHALSAKKMDALFNSENGDSYITVTNNSKEDTKECECVIVFYNSINKIESVAQVSMNNGSVPSGETVKENVKHAPIGCDTKIYVNAYTE